MNYILFDDYSHSQLLPLTYTKPVSKLRIGILTLEEKWNHALDAKCSYKTVDYLSEKYKTVVSDDNLFINSSIIPKENLVKKIKELKPQSVLVKGEVVIAARTHLDFDCNEIDKLERVEVEIDFIKLNKAHDIFTFNYIAIEQDFALITQNRKSQPISVTVNVLGKENIFIEEGAKVEFATINATAGSVYIGKDAEIMEGAILRGPIALCNNSVIKMGAKLYGGTTLGPYVKCGGEVENTVFIGYANKAHDGFLGNSVIGEWCNLGADTNNSNLKNNYAEAKLWNYVSNRFERTGLQFCGLIMGDHSKSAINCMFNTGTVLGVSTNIVGQGFPRNFVPSFSQGGASGFETLSFKQALKTAQIVMKRRSIDLDEQEEKILKHVFELSSKYRKF